MVPLGHVGPVGLPERSDVMLLMPILPMMLIGTILVAGALDRRGLFGEPPRKVAVGVPLAAIAAGLSLAAAAMQFAGIGEAIAKDPALGIYLLGVAWFQVIWSLAHLVARNAVSALIGIVGNGVALGLWLAAQTLGLPFVPAGIQSGVGLRDIFAGSFELALIIALVPTIYPSLAARLADRQMQVPRAFVLAGFCVAATALLTSLALVGS